ncbi:MAG: YitT family protein [Dethiobacter sp.]|nr:YitT family protein [Dethiobacter sp.]
MKCWSGYLIDLLGILAGSVILAVAMNLFLIPHQLAAGGVSGLAVILFHLLNIPIGLTIIVVNIPLFIWAYFLLGPRVVLQSLFGTIFFSVAVELTAFLPQATEDIMLSAVYGGVVMGIGVGLVFRFRGSSGGTTILSLILNKVAGLSTGQGLLGGDLAVIALAIFIFGGEAAMYAALSLFISSWVIDVVQEGLGLAKSVLIITSQGEEINRRLLQELGRGVTRLEGRGGYTGEDREVLLCVVASSETAFLKSIIHEVDSKAFMIIGNATEVHGEGFRRARD